MHALPKTLLQAAKAAPRRLIVLALSLAPLLSTPVPGSKEDTIAKKQSLILTLNPHERVYFQPGASTALLHTFLHPQDQQPIFIRWLPLYWATTNQTCPTHIYKAEDRNGQPCLVVGMPSLKGGGNGTSTSKDSSSPSPRPTTTRKSESSTFSDSYKREVFSSILKESRRSSAQGTSHSSKRSFGSSTSKEKGGSSSKETFQSSLLNETLGKSNPPTSSSSSGRMSDKDDPFPFFSSTTAPKRPSKNSGNSNSYSSWTSKSSNKGTVPSYDTLKDIVNSTDLQDDSDCKQQSISNTPRPKTSTTSLSNRTGSKKLSGSSSETNPKDSSNLLNYKLPTPFTSNSSNHKPFPSSRTPEDIIKSLLTGTTAQKEPPVNYFGSTEHGPLSPHQLTNIKSTLLSQSSDKNGSITTATTPSSHKAKRSKKPVLTTKAAQASKEKSVKQQPAPNQPSPGIDFDPTKSILKDVKALEQRTEAYCQAAENDKEFQQAKQQVKSAQEALYQSPEDPNLQAALEDCQANLEATDLYQQGVELGCDLEGARQSTASGAIVNREDTDVALAQCHQNEHAYQGLKQVRQVLGRPNTPPLSQQLQALAEGGVENLKDTIAPVTVPLKAIGKFSYNAAISLTKGEDRLGIKTGYENAKKTLQDIEAKAQQVLEVGPVETVKLGVKSLKEEALTSYENTKNAVVSCYNDETTPEEIRKKHLKVSAFDADNQARQTMRVAGYYTTEAALFLMGGGITEGLVGLAKSNKAIRRVIKAVTKTSKAAKLEKTAVQITKAKKAPKPKLPKGKKPGIAPKPTKAPKPAPQKGSYLDAAKRGQKTQPPVNKGNAASKPNKAPNPPPQKDSYLQAAKRGQKAQQPGRPKVPENGLVAQQPQQPIQTRKSKIHGNSKECTKPQHGYVIRDKSSNPIEYGISGQSLNRDGTSRRIKQKLRTKHQGKGYSGEVLERGIPNRKQALAWEQEQVNAYAKGNNRKGPGSQKIPKPKKSPGPKKF